MKRLICFLMIAVMLLASGCGQNSKADKHTEEVNQLLQEYLNNIDEFEVSTRQVGDPKSYIAMEDSIAVGIFYPETDVKELNEDMEDWIDDTVEYYQDDVIADFKEEGTSELTVSYSSYLINDEVISVKLKGSFISSQMAHPVDIVKTFIAKGDDVITIKDIVKEEQYDKLVNVVATKVKVKAEDIDDEFLENAVVTNEGVEVVIERGKYLPMSDGTKEVKLSYDEVKDYLVDEFVFEAKGSEEKDNLDKVHKGAASDIDPNKPMVALTFDDGPSAHTERLLDIYKEHGGKGTFFVLGYLVSGNEDTLQRAVSEGHELGNHSWNHSQLTNLSDEELIDQIMQTRAMINSATGIDTTIMRPPYGAYDENVLAIGGNLDVSFINWSLDTLDWKTRNADAIYNKIMTTVKDGDIILCHDLHGTTVDAMERVIPALIEEGYQLVTVSELLEYKSDSLEPGKMYFRR